MKMIICAMRNPGMTRSEFFHHLRHVHWPLVRDHASVAAALAGYVQNHALGPDSPQTGSAPFDIAVGRDSVIELFFEGEEGLQQLVSTPDYFEYIRPDEEKFNDLPKNIMVKTEPEVFFNSSAVGRSKRFDFLAMATGCNGEEFIYELTKEASELALNPHFTGKIDRLVYNWNEAKEAGDDKQGFGHGSFGCVRELWANSVAALECPNVRGRVPNVVDGARSFSVFCTEFTMIPPQKFSNPS